MTAPRTTAQAAADQAFAAYQAGCACDLTDHRHTAECAARWDVAAEAAEVAAAAAPFEVGQRVRFTADIGTPEMVHVTGVITESHAKESVVRTDARVPGYVAELRSFNRYIEPIPEPIFTAAELDGFEPATEADAALVLSERARAAELDHAEPIGPEDSGERFELNAEHTPATGPGSMAAYVQGVNGSIRTRRAQRVRDAREYRAELRAYGVPVAQLAYPFPIGPDPEYLPHSDRRAYHAAWARAVKLGAAAEYAAALRTLADIVEATPEVSRYNDFYVWYGSNRADLAALARAGLAHGATVAKDVDPTSYNLELGVGPLKVTALASRSAVCERVVTGTDEVTELVPDPEYVAPEPAPAPMVSVTRTVERVEWRCAPLMADS